MTEKTADTIEQDNAAFDMLIEQKRYQMLKTLLLKEEEQRLGQLESYFNNPDAHAEKIAQVLPQALQQTDTTALHGALSDTVQSCIIESIQENPVLYADALYPVIFPAIKKSIAEALKQMMQSLNQAIEQGFSLHRFAWHYEAWRSGLPYREVVLRHTLAYRVEQAFLIHRETGLLLHHVSLEDVDAQRDGDAVSAMLTAIQDFTKDSFAVNSDDYLDMIEIGEYTVFLSRGSYAVLACVIQGIAPYSLREKFDVILHDIHQQYGALLKNFAGDSAPLAVTEPDLQACLLAERKQLDKTEFSPKYILVPLMVLCAMLAYWGYDNWQFEQRAADYVRLLQHNQSIVITQQNYHSGQLLINGLYDPLSEHPDTLIAQSRLQADEIQSHWQAYQSLAPVFVEQRLKQLLQPPPTVSLTLENNRLVITGIADDAWINKLAIITPAIAGVSGVDSDKLQSYQQQIEILNTQIKNIAVYFMSSSTELTEDQAQKLADLVAALQQIQALSHSINKTPHLLITGQADVTGTLEKNSVLAQKRAAIVLEYLQQHGVFIDTNVKAQLGQLNKEGTTQRKVSFAVLFN
ncbi:MAG: OmpA family protein [Methylococcales bacterium]|nr:OmpA family protein [Methylococcales bacterium]